MVERALRGVMREALTHAVKHGLPGAHHFYVTFRMMHPGVRVDDSLKARFPEEMTIVLQHQFWDLAVEEGGFSVTLSFSNVPQRLVIPFAAVTTFSDPSVNFALQFQAIAEPGGAKPTVAAATPAKQPAAAKSGAEKPAGKSDGAKTVGTKTVGSKLAAVPPLPKSKPAPAATTPEEKVVTLDSFRKK